MIVLEICSFQFFYTIYSSIFFLPLIFSSVSYIVLLLFKYSWPHCLPTNPPPPHPSLPSTLNPTPFGFVHVSNIYVTWWPFPYFPPSSLSLLPSCYCQFALYFNAVDYIFLACLFCCLGCTYRWDHMVFVFHCLAYFT